MRFSPLAIAVLLFLIFPIRAHAQTDYNTDQLLGFSESEKVGFAYYNLIRKDPPVEEWIVARDDYIKARPMPRLHLLDYDRIRLRDGYAGYVPDRDLLRIKIMMLYSISDNPDYKTNQSVNAKGLTKRLTIKFPDKRFEKYFPFQLGKMWIGVIPMDLDSFTKVDMTEDEYKKFCTDISNCGPLQNHPYTTNIVLSPVQADDKKPVIDGDLPVFPLLSKVASISLYQGTDILWRETAPWYQNQTTKELMTLHK